MPNLLQWLGIEKLNTLREIISQNGGIRGFLWTLYRTDDAKIGTLVGVDRLGNKYYENHRYFYGRNRWVIYSEKVYLDYDGSQVPSEWYGWLHYKTDLKPYEDPSRPKHSWMIYGNENMTGTPKQYVPYSTTQPKIIPWQPPKK